jgi:hypothetical protein
MTIRLHPATTHGDRLHRLGFRFVDDMRVGYTGCGLLFMFGDWRDRSHAALPRCAECWS